MSQENVDIVRRYFEAVEQTFRAYWEAPRSLAESLKAGEVGPAAEEILTCLHPDCEWQTAILGITFRGHGDMAAGFDQLVEAASLYSVALRTATDLGGDQVLAEVKAAMKGKASDIDVDMTLFLTVTVQGGLITQVREYRDRADALEATGLRE